jgi:hypothetical protein
LQYPRDHTWGFDGGHTMTATAAPAYLGNPANVDPEEQLADSDLHRPSRWKACWPDISWPNASIEEQRRAVMPRRKGRLISPGEASLLAAAMRCW